MPNKLSSMSFDSKALRQVLGHFATGIAVATTRDETGQFVGVTINSFNSVSLSPPLVLFSLEKQSTFFSTFQASGCFAINILTSEQQFLSDRFARQKVNQFEGVRIFQQHTGSPLLESCLATLDCVTVYQYEGGDHIIFVGEVKAIQSFTGKPLLYYQGQYTQLTE